MKKLFSRLSDFIGKSDRTNLVCLCTAALFLFFGLFQLLMVIFTPLARTIDHVFLIIVDVVIAAVCVFCILYRNGKVDQIVSFLRNLPTKHPESQNKQDPADTSSEAALNESRRQPAKAPGSPRHPSGSQQSPSSRPGYADSPRNPSGSQQSPSSRPGYANPSRKPSGSQQSESPRPGYANPSRHPSGSQQSPSSRPGYAGSPRNPSGSQQSPSSRPEYANPSRHPSGSQQSPSSRPKYAGSPRNPSGSQQSGASDGQQESRLNRRRTENR